MTTANTLVDDTAEAVQVDGEDAVYHAEDRRFDDATWGDLKGKDLMDAVNNAFVETAQWRRNLFNLPTGKVGQDFIAELTRILDQFASGTIFEPIALTLATIMFPLLLQKPSANSKTKDHVRYLEKRLVLWKSGILTDLLTEGRAIQKKLVSKLNQKSPEPEQRFISYGAREGVCCC